MIFSSECKTCEVLKDQLRVERERVKECPTCESLRTQLERVQAENTRLMNHIINPPKLEGRTEAPETPLPIPPKTLPWNIRRQMLEAEDRRKAEILRQREQELTESKQIDELEKELQIKEQQAEEQIKNG